MKRNCNLELRLVPSNIMEEICRSQRNDQQQQLTVFYNGSVSVCDVTELQARAILLVASREVEERMKWPTATGSQTPSPATQPPSPTNLASPLCSPSTGLSMKRSLQRFLQKRKNRSQAVSPYYHRHH